MIDRVGQQLGNYRLIRSLGSGGFADVYLGEHIYLNTQAAIKILQTRLAQNDLQVFLAEARTIANLTHRNIVQVLEFGVEKDTPFLVMTYAPNGTLRQRHPTRSRLSTSEVVSYIRQVADALQYAHDRKVIHRDVKPENMLVGQNGDILLSDFGIAVVTQSSRYSGQEVGGTAAYMAPEQLQGRASPASDQYALAVTAYEWLTGERPFNGSFAEICSQHLLTPPAPLRQKVPSLPPAVEQVVLIALNKDPQRRFPSVQAFANALAQASGVNTPVTYNNPPQAEEQISTFVKPPSRPTPPPPGSNPSFPYPAPSPSQQGNTPSFPYPASNNPSQRGNVNPPPVTHSGMASSGQFPPQGPPIPSERGKKRRGTMFVIIALVVLLVAAASAGGIYVFASKRTPSTVGVGQTQPVATSPQTGPTTAPTSITTSTPATPTPASGNYSAAQPGPGCDTGGGIWTVQGLNQIQCASGTEISSNYNSLGYLYLQLPNNATFSPTNKISVMGGNLDYDDGYVCLGLAEQGTSTGVLGEFCGNGGWFIYSLSSTGVITQPPLSQGITSMRTSEGISLTLQGNTVLFSIDTETYKATISSIQPVKVGITSFNETSNNYNPITLTNFSYISTS